LPTVFPGHKSFSFDFLALVVLDTLFLFSFRTVRGNVS
jgi:hypothetical protein